MRCTLALALLTAPAFVAATLQPAYTNSKGMCPKTVKCKVIETSPPIQAAECSHNTRTHDRQTFAVFKVDHQYDGNHGYPYGTCYAYTCEEVPSAQDMIEDPDCWTFFWNQNGVNESVGTGCIRDPDHGQCGCEESKHGKFYVGKTDCV